MKQLPLVRRSADTEIKSTTLKGSDREILVAAEIAEALAVTTYTNIINIAPFFARIPADDQGYLVGARQEEMSHYLLEQSVTGQPSPFTSFYYPMNMFADAQTTLNTLVTLEDAFIAAYLVGVRNFSTCATARDGSAHHGHRKRPSNPGPRDWSRRGAAGWWPDHDYHRHSGSGRERGSSEQQRL